MSKKEVEFCLTWTNPPSSANLLRELALEIPHIISILNL